MDKQTTIIEVSGVKLEVDLRTARRIDELKIGSRVKCLRKDYSGMKTMAGVVVGFEPFPSLPTIVIAYLDVSYGGAGLKFQSFNAETKDFEVIPDIDNNALEIDRDEALSFFAREIESQRLKLREAEQKREFFLTHFGRYFSQVEAATAGVA